MEDQQVGVGVTQLCPVSEFKIVDICSFRLSTLFIFYSIVKSLIFVQMISSLKLFHVLFF